MQRCTNCFSLKHENKDCTSDRSCYKCDGRHHETLCSKNITRFADKGATGTNSSTAIGSLAVVTTACNSAFGEVILKTATAWLIGPDGKETKTILFVDRESHRTWIIESISKELQLRRNIGRKYSHNSVWREERETGSTDQPDGAESQGQL